jgi:excisionase family DNA binding protein
MIYERFYTVDQVSGLLHMHPKTIQRYIREGKLRATKIGKGWRISGHDLSLFTEGTANTEPTEPGGAPSKDCVQISSVIDIACISKEHSIRIVNTLTAALNAKPCEYGSTSMNAQFIEDERRVRITLWGGLNFMQTILSSIDAMMEV